MTGQYYQQPPPGQQPHGMVPPEAETIKSFLKITGIICLIIGILMLLAGIGTMLLLLVAIGGFAVFGLIWAIWPILSGIFGILIYMNCKTISNMIDRRQYEQAKSKTLIWMIIGFIFGLLPGILLLIAYLKFDPLINATRGQGYSQPPPAHAPPPPPQQQRTCLGCGQQIPLNFNNCPHCGKEAGGQHAQQQAGFRTCLGCGQNIQASYNACPHCGKQAGQ